MKKIILLFILLIIPIKASAIETSATSAILMDIDSNRILYSKDIHNVRSVASISKIMTAIIAIENGDLDKKIKIGPYISKAYGSAIYIKDGEELTLRDLVYGLMLRSGNDAALAIEKNVSSNFIKLMNDKANEIGMNNTTFNNASGLDNEKANYSTAYDMALLMSYAMKNDEFKKITGTKKYVLKTNKNNYVWTNKNKLLFSYKYITGGKTGFTDIARRTLVESASKDNLNLVTVTLNDGNDWNDHKDMFEYGFENYNSYEILKEGIVNVYDDIYYSDYDLYLKNNFKYPLTKEEAKRIVLKIELEKKRIVEVESVVGKIKVMLDENILKEEDIYIREKDKDKKSLFKQLIDWIKNL